MAGREQVEVPQGQRVSAVSCPSIPTPNHTGLWLLSLALATACCSPSYG